MVCQRNVRLPGVPGFGIDRSGFFLFSGRLAWLWKLLHEMAFQEGGPEHVGIAMSCGTIERDELGAAFGHVEAGDCPGGMKIDDGHFERLV